LAKGQNAPGYSASLPIRGATWEEETPVQAASDREDLLPETSYQDQRIHIWAMIKRSE
jgi:hypothetical protein